MWRDICLANRERILAEMSSYTKKLGELRSLLETGDGAALERLFAEAREARDQWLKASS